MIKKSSLILIVSLLSVTTAGCGLFGGGDSEQAEESPQPQASPPSPTPSPLALDQPTEPSDTAAIGLIPSTDPNQRRQQIQKGRENPFALLPIQPIISQKPSEDSPPVTPPATEVATNSQPPSACIQIGASAYVPPPMPNEARAVLVSGVMELPSRSVAIVKAPNESVQRYVSSGATLANGQVLVRAIYPNASPPVVVLEQYGVAVPRPVGSPPEAPVAPPPAPPTNPDGFGKVRDLVLLKVELGGEAAGNPLVNGTLCNDGPETVTVSSLVLNLRDKGNNSVINSMTIELPAPYIINSGQKAEFDGRAGSQDTAQKSELGLRGRNKDNVIIELVGWK